VKILYVEDDDDSIYSVRHRLERAGHTILVARDGERGVMMAQAEKPDLVLMDLSLPLLDGWEATRRLKAAPETRRTPVIALSAHAMRGEKEKALGAGCDDFDTKPVDFARLLAKIEAVTTNKAR
jgi:CheY-like chemotaxis protein